MDKSWITRRYKPSDREGVFELYDIVHGKRKGDVCRKNWVWEYETSPYIDTAPTVWVAECEGKIVGLHPAIPIMLECGGNRRKALWSVDLMTHPEYRGRGIFKGLTDKLVRESKEEGVSIFLVLPNENSGPLLRKRGWFDIRSFSVMIKPLKIGPLLKQVRLRSIPKLFIGGLIFSGRFLRGLLHSGLALENSSVEITEVTAFDERISAFFEHVAREYDFIAVRDEDYLNWRYAQCPQKKHTIFLAEENSEILGFIILSVEGREVDNGYIVEFLTKRCHNQLEVIELLLKTAIRNLQKQNAATIEICAQNGPYEDVLKKYGFAVFPRKMFWGYDLVAHVDDNDDCLADLREPDRKWYISRGDADSDIATD